MTTLIINQRLKDRYATNVVPLMRKLGAELPPEVDDLAAMLPGCSGPWLVQIKAPICGEVFNVEATDSPALMVDDARLVCVGAARGGPWPTQIEILNVFGRLAYCRATTRAAQAWEGSEHSLAAFSAEYFTLLADRLHGLDCFYAVDVCAHTSMSRSLALQRPLLSPVLLDAEIVCLQPGKCEFGVPCPRCDGTGEWSQPRRGQHRATGNILLGPIYRSALEPRVQPCRRCRGQRFIGVRFFPHTGEFGRGVATMPAGIAPEFLQNHATLLPKVPSVTVFPGQSVVLFNPHSREELPCDRGARAVLERLSGETGQPRDGTPLGDVTACFGPIAACLERSLQSPRLEQDIHLLAARGGQAGGNGRIRAAGNTHTPLAVSASCRRGPEVTQMEYVQAWCSPYNLDHPLLYAMMNDEVATASDCSVHLVNAAIARHPAQLRAVQMGLSEAPFTLVEGPPGTGKTTVITEVVLQQVRQGRKVLVCSQAHQAVRNVLERLHKIGGVRMARWARNEEKLSAIERLYHVASEQGGQRCGVDAVQQAEVLFSTCVGLASWKGVTSRGRAWLDLVIVDEAGHATIPESIIPLMYGQRAMLIGDKMQLPPLPPDECRDSCGLSRQPQFAVRELGESNDVGVAGWSIGSLMSPCWLERSLFEWLWWTRPNIPRVMLDEQFRMHPDIAGFIGRVFYENRLKSAVSASDRQLEFGEFSRPVCLASTASDPDRFEERVGSSYCNRLEATIITNILRQAEAQLGSRQEFGVITPYAAQAALVRREMAAAGIPFRQVGLGAGDVASVDSFQGSERDVMIISLTRSPQSCGRCGGRRRTSGAAHACPSCGGRGWLGTGLSFVRDLRRLNVAFSRARKMLILVGDIRAVTSPRFQAGAEGGRVLAAFENYVADRGRVLRFWEHGPGPWVGGRRRKPQVSPQVVTGAW